MRLTQDRRPTFAVWSVAALLASMATAAPVLAQTCPTSSITLNGSSQQITGPNSSGSLTYVSHLDYLITDFGGTTSISLDNSGVATLSARGSYRFLGPATGTPVSQSVGATITGSVGGVWGEPACGSNYLQVAVMLDGSPILSRTWWTEVYQGECLGAGGPGQTTPYLITRPAGTSFQLTPDFYATTGWYSRAGARVELQFGSLPPGAFLVRCDGVTVTGVLGVTDETVTGLKIGSVWPNPSRGAFHAKVSVPAGGSAFLRLMDVSGRIIRARAVDASPTARDIAFDDHLVPGTYFLQLSQGAHTAVRQVVIGN